MKEKIKSTVAEQPSFFLYDPWSKNWTPEKHRYPSRGGQACYVQWVVTKYRAQKTPAIEGSQQGQIMKKGIRLDFLLRECNGVPTKLWGFQPPISRDHRCSPNY